MVVFLLTYSTTVSTKADAKQPSLLSLCQHTLFTALLVSPISKVFGRELTEIPNLLLGDTGTNPA